MLERLQQLLKKTGTLNQRLIESSFGVPSCSTFARRFGSLQDAYRRIGYQAKHDLDWIVRKHECDDLLRSIADGLSVRLQKAGLVASFDPGRKLLTINSRFAISLRLARCWRCSDRRSPIWSVHRRASFPEGYLIAVRLDEENTNALDYILLPSSRVVGLKLRLTDTGWRRFHGCNFQTLSELSKAVLRIHRASSRSQQSRNKRHKKGHCSVRRLSG